MNVINVSGNELWALFRRTLEALYTNRQDYNDVAQLVLWLELHGLEGMKLLTEALPRLENTELPPPELTISQTNHCVIKAAGHSLLDVALSVIDFTIANTLSDQQSHLSIQSCHQRRVAIPCLVRYGRRHFAAISWWHEANDNNDHIVIIRSGELLPAYYITTGLLPKDTSNNLEMAGFLHDSQMQSWLEQYFQNIQHYLQTARPRISQPQFLQRYQASLDSGMIINPADYKKLCIVADRVLIEASETSRLGAGE